MMHDIVKRAEAAIGSPFRLHGRSLETGLDCIGLVLHALGIDEKAVGLPTGYSLRGGNPDRLFNWAARLGLAKVTEAEAGDIVITRPSPVQLHLLIATESGHIHAHAGLRRVVAMPGKLPWLRIANLRKI